MPWRVVGKPIRVGEKTFKKPACVVWDDREDLYLVSNINGKLTGADDNGFIARVAPNGELIAPK